MMAFVPVAIAVEIVVVKIAPQRVSAGKLDQKYGMTVHCTRVDGAVKRNRDPRLQVEAVKLVEQRDIQAIGGIGGTVRERQVDAQSRVLVAVQHGETIAGRGRLRGRIQVKQGMRGGNGQGWQENNCRKQ